MAKQGDPVSPLPWGGHSRGTPPRMVAEDKKITYDKSCGSSVMLCFASNPGPSSSSASTAVRHFSPAARKSRQGELAGRYTIWGQASIWLTVAVARRRQELASRLATRAATGPRPVSSVGGYAVRPVTADLPDIGEVTAYVVDEEAEKVDDVPDWVPAEWLSPVMGDSDVYGAIGVWPAAFVAAEEVMKYAGGKKGGDWSCLELGCGAGFPSLVAAKRGAASVYALDTEQLTLDLLQAAFDQQGQGRLIPLLGDAQDLPQEPLSSVPLVVVSDLLYSVPLGRALGESLAKWLKGQERKLILTDGGRSGRWAFLEAFSEAHGSQAYFEDVPVLPWAPQKGDFFDGSETATVGLLRY